MKMVSSAVASCSCKRSHIGIKHWGCRKPGRPRFSFWLFFLPGVEGLLSRCFLAALKSLKGNFADFFLWDVGHCHSGVSPTFPNVFHTPKSYSQFASVFYSRFQVLEIRNLRIYVGRFFPILITSL